MNWIPRGEKPVAFQMLLDSNSKSPSQQGQWPGMITWKPTTYGEPTSGKVCLQLHWVPSAAPLFIQYWGIYLSDMTVSCFMDNLSCLLVGLACPPSSYLTYIINSSWYLGKVLLVKHTVLTADLSQVSCFPLKNRKVYASSCTCSSSTCSDTKQDVIWSSTAWYCINNKATDTWGSILTSISHFQNPGFSTTLCIVTQKKVPLWWIKLTS